MQIPPRTDTLAAQFAREAKRRQHYRAIRLSRILAIIAIFMMISASFIPDPVIRRWIGLPILGIILILKGFISYRTWTVKSTSPIDQNAY